MANATCTRAAFVRIGGLAAAAGLALACGVMPVYAEEAVSHESGAGTAQSTLVIGREDHTVKVPCTAELDPEALIAALAEETGWDLTLSASPTLDEDSNSVTVAFAEGSAIYAEPPEQQKDDYHVYDAQDLIYTVLNSVASTLYQNLEYSYVYFSAPDGGPIELSNGGYDFYLSNLCSWNESMVLATNEPLPDDSFGIVYLDPNGTMTAGWPALSLLTMRDGVEAGTGTITVTDGDGNVVDIIDAADSERVTCEPLTEDTLGMLNYRNGTGCVIALNAPLGPNMTYGVNVEAGAFVCGDIAIKEITPDSWQIETLGFGIGDSDFPVTGSITVDTPYSMEVLLDDSVMRVDIIPADPSVAEFSTTEFVETGALTVAPTKTGVLSFDVTFVLADGTTLPILYSYEVVAG